MSADQQGPIENTSEVLLPVVTSVAHEQQVIRCGCTEQQKAAPDWHRNLGLHCPNPKAVEDLGVVAFWHADPEKVAAWQAERSANNQGVGTCHLAPQP